MLRYTILSILVSLVFTPTAHAQQHTVPNLVFHAKRDQTPASLYSKPNPLAPRYSRLPQKYGVSFGTTQGWTAMFAVLGAVAGAAIVGTIVGVCVTRAKANRRNAQVKAWKQAKANFADDNSDFKGPAPPRETKEPVQAGKPRKLKPSACSNVYNLYQSMLKNTMEKANNPDELKYFQLIEKRYPACFQKGLGLQLLKQRQKRYTQQPSPQKQSKERNPVPPMPSTPGKTVMFLRAGEGSY